jgi:hypothetical protein
MHVTARANLLVCVSCIWECCALQTASETLRETLLVAPIQPGGSAFLRFSLLDTHISAPNYSTSHAHKSAAAVGLRGSVTNFHRRNYITFWLSKKLRVHLKNRVIRCAANNLGFLQC